MILLNIDNFQQFEEYVVYVDVERVIEEQRLWLVVLVWVLVVSIDQKFFRFLGRVVFLVIFFLVFFNFSEILLFILGRKWKVVVVGFELVVKCVRNRLIFKFSRGIYFEIQFGVVIGKELCFGYNYELFIVIQI